MTQTPGPITPRPLRAYPSIDLAWHRLADYLGPDFLPDLTNPDACGAYVQAEFTALGPDRFYRHSRGYLYELTLFHFMPHKDPFFGIVTSFADAHSLRTIGDIGCGVGLDAQALIDAGYEVAAYDFASPSLDYAAWRLEREIGGSAMIRPLDQLGREQHDIVYAVDVLEHVQEPCDFIRLLFAVGRYVCVNLFEHDVRPWDGEDIHFPQNHWSLIPVFARYGELVQVGISGATIATMWRRLP